jgi:hypothetical protein
MTNKVNAEKYSPQKKQPNLQDTKPNKPKKPHKQHQRQLKGLLAV